MSAIASTPRVGWVTRRVTSPLLTVCTRCFGSPHPGSGLVTVHDRCHGGPPGDLDEQRVQPAGSLSLNVAEPSGRHRDAEDIGEELHGQVLRVEHVERERPDRGTPNTPVLGLRGAYLRRSRPSRCNAAYRRHGRSRPGSPGGGSITWRSMVAAMGTSAGNSSPSDPVSHHAPPPEQPSNRTPSSTRDRNALPATRLGRSFATLIQRFSRR
jgi:hypothetical protein